MMKHLATTLLIALLAAGLQSCARNNVHPDSVFTLSTQDALGFDPYAHFDVAGTWQIEGAAVDGDATSFKGKLVKPLAKNKLKKKLNKAFKKIKLTSRLSRITLGEDGKYTFFLFARKIQGPYTYDPVDESLTLRWKGIPFKIRLKRDGKKLHMLMPADRLLHLVSLMSDWTGNKTVRDLTFLHDNFDDVEVGFQLKRVKP